MREKEEIKRQFEKENKKRKKKKKKKIPLKTVFGDLE